MSLPNINTLMERCLGVVLASATGDALGAPYASSPDLLAKLTAGESVPFTSDATNREYYWTESTEMAVPILQALNMDLDPASAKGQKYIIDEWLRLFPHVHHRLDERLKSLLAETDKAQNTEVEIEIGDRMAELAREQEDKKGRNKDSRAVARLAPLAIGYLKEGQEAALATAADKLAALTTSDQPARDMAALFCLGVRNAIVTGNPDLKAQVKHLPAHRRATWEAFLTEAETTTPETYKDTNNTAVGALEEATAIVAVATGAKDALDRAVRVGGECGRVACITGALAGAKHGPRKIYETLGEDWKDWKLRGEELTASDLEGLVEQYVHKKYF